MVNGEEQDSGAQQKKMNEMLLAKLKEMKAELLKKEEDYQAMEQQFQLKEKEHQKMQELDQTMWIKSLGEKQAQFQKIEDDLRQALEQEKESKNAATTALEQVTVELKKCTDQSHEQQIQFQKMEHELRQSLDDGNKDKEQLRVELEEKKSNVESLKMSQRQLTSELSAKSSQLTEIQAKLAEANAEKEKLAEKKEDIQRQKDNEYQKYASMIQTLQSDLDTTKRELANKTAIAEELERECKEKIEHTQAALESLNEELAALRLEKESAKQLQGTISALNAELAAVKEGNTRDLQSIKEQHQVEIEGHLKSLDELRAVNDSLQKSLTDTSREYQETIDKLDAELQFSKAAHEDELKGQAERWQYDITMRNTECAEHKNKIEALSVSLQQAEEIKAALASEIAAAKKSGDAEVEAIRAKLAQAQQKHDTALADLQTKLDSQHKQLQQEQKSKGEVEKRVSELEKDKQNSQAVRQENESLRKEVAQGKEEIKVVQAALHKAETISEQALVAANNKIKDLEKSGQQAKKEWELQAAKVAKQNAADMKKLEGQIKSQKAENAELSTQAEELKKLTAEATAAQKTLKAQVAQSEKKAQTLLSESKELQAKVDSLLGEVDGLKKMPPAKNPLNPVLLASVVLLIAVIAYMYTQCLAIQH